MSEQRYEGFVPGTHVIEGYGAGGFRFAGMSHRGSILALPSGIHAWTPAQMADVTAESFEPLFAEQSGTIDMLILGTGETLVPVSRELREMLNGRRIRVDSMATGAAISTYNILLGERRRVAAAFLAVS